MLKTDICVDLRVSQVDSIQHLSEYSMFVGDLIALLLKHKLVHLMRAQLVTPKKCPLSTKSANFKMEDNFPPRKQHGDCSPSQWLSICRVKQLELHIEDQYVLYSGKRKHCMSAAR